MKAIKKLNKKLGSKKWLMIIGIICSALLIFVLFPNLARATGTEPAGVAAPLDNLINVLFGDNVSTVNILLLLTLLSLLPSILLMLTAFTRIIIVLSFIRNAVGLQQMPPNQVIIGLALFLTLFVMMPVINQINEEAYQPYMEGELTQSEFVKEAMNPIRSFMLRQTYKSDLTFFYKYAEAEPPESVLETPTHILIPSFITSELKRAFQIGFFIYIPFIVIDMVVASVLMAMGMMMLPPAMISLPFKVLLFVVVDGWQLTIGTLLTSFG